MNNKPWKFCSKFYWRYGKSCWFGEESKKKSVGKAKEKFDKSYDNTEETQNFIVNETGFISFTNNFKYLESWISYDLNDRFDLEIIIMKANQSMDALNVFGMLRK